ncbi:hypothetical protein PSAB6_170131 [Paraburkholderia sabiae]|nr:hypothetical protein PSAB6_170131 [Paraburkholderia sabiae]
MSGSDKGCRKWPCKAHETRLKPARRSIPRCNRCGDTTRTGGRSANVSFFSDESGFDRKEGVVGPLNCIIDAETLAHPFHSE